MPELIFFRATTLNNPDLFEPQMRVYAGSACKWDTMKIDVPTFERMPPPEAMAD